MSATPGNHSEYKIYNRTFLYKVEARFHYTSAAPDFNRRLADFVAEQFGVTFPLGRIDAMALAPLRFNQPDEIVKVKVTDDFVEVAFKHEGYTSFGESLMPVLEPFARFFAETSSTLYNLSLRKTNLFVYEPDADTTLDYVRTKIFSVAFNATDPADLEPAKDGEWHQYLHMDDPQSGIDLHVFAVIEHIPENDSHMGASLQTLTKINTQIEPHELAQRFAVMNGILYQAFHWAINPDIIRLMTDSPDGDNSENDTNE